MIHIAFSIFALTWIGFLVSYAFSKKRLAIICLLLMSASLIWACIIGPHEYHHEEPIEQDTTIVVKVDSLKIN